MTTCNASYDQAVKEAKDLQAQMGNDCAAATKAAKCGPEQVHLRPGTSRGTGSWIALRTLRDLALPRRGPMSEQL